MGLIRRSFGYKSTVAVEMAFKVLVRPLLEYCCAAWNPYLVKHIDRIEAIQRRASRLICRAELSYEERLQKLKWLTLELRRKYLCLVQMYKIIFGLCDIDATKYFDLIGETRTRSNHKFKLRPKHARTNYFQFSNGLDKSRQTSIRKKWTTTLSLQNMFRSIIDHLQL